MSQMRNAVLIIAVIAMLAAALCVKAAAVEAAPAAGPRASDVDHGPDMIVVPAGLNAFVSEDELWRAFYHDAGKAAQLLRVLNVRHEYRGHLPSVRFAPARNVPGRPNLIPADRQAPFGLSGQSALCRPAPQTKSTRVLLAGGFGSRDAGRQSVDCPQKPQGVCRSAGIRLGLPGALRAEANLTEADARDIRASH